jgi:hypothetical protein
MNETRRTVIYVAVASVMALVAWWMTPPVEITPQEFAAAKIGEPFYKDFNPNDATSIRVVGFDEAKAMHKTFGVKFENGKWTIPSHHNYPADGADRLAKTAASAKGIKREEFASDSDQNHEKLGVVDPLDEDRSKLKGRGQRITLSKGDDTLVDLIIGKQLKDRPGYYYVRKPDEKATYVAKLSLDLSTKFSDWIETDLLKLASSDLKEITIDNSSIDEAKGRIVTGEINRLERDKSADPWKLEGLDDSKEELETSKVTTMVNTLDDLKLVGVRPKPKGLRPDLSIDRAFVRNQDDLNEIIDDLQRKGFIPLAGRNKEPHLYSKEGELQAATNKGVVYTLKFGKVFLGDESEIEIGSASEEDEKKEEGNGEDKDKTAAKDKDAGKQSSRYLFVAARFDDEYLEPAPEEPERPAGVPAEESEEKAPKISPKKSGKKSAPKDEPETDDGDAASDSENPADDNQAKSNGDQCGSAAGAGDDDTSTDPVAKDDADSPAKDDDDQKDESTDEPAKKDGDTAKSAEDKSSSGEKKKEKSPEEIKKDYETKLKKYKSDLKAYEEKVAAGKKTVDELNARFGDWYYVIPAESFNKLHLSRKELVKEKGKTADDKKTDKTPADPFPSSDADAGGDDPDSKKDANDDQDAP